MMIAMAVKNEKRGGLGENAIPCLPFLIVSYIKKLFCLGRIAKPIIFAEENN